MVGSSRVLARRYARALFQSSGPEKVEETQGELDAVLKALASYMGFFRHPRVGAAQLKAAFHGRGGDAVSARTRRFIGLLVDKRRIPLLPVIVAEHKRLVDEYKGLVSAQVNSAGPLTPEQKETLCSRLRRFSGRGVTLDVRTVPELLGGVVVRLGDWVFDGSIRGQLERLAAKLECD